MNVTRLLGPPARHWTDHAVCGNRLDDLFFPVGETEPAKQQERDAKALCDVCPVRQDCLDWAQETKQLYGIWGGLNTEERYQLRAGKRRYKPRGPGPAPHGTVSRYTNSSCRCGECKAAKAAEKRAYTQQKRRTA